MLLGLKLELDCADDPQASLVVSRSSDNPDVYRIEGFRIQAKVNATENSLARVSQWVAEAGIDACGNVAVGVESGSVVVRIDTVK